MEANSVRSVNYMKVSVCMEAKFVSHHVDAMIVMHHGQALAVTSVC